MIAFGHTAVGTLVGLYGYNAFGLSSPVEGIAITTGISFASHYLLDLIPHGHFFPGTQYKKKIMGAIIFDFLASVLLFTSILYFREGLSLKFLYVLFGIGASQFPDIIDGLMFTGYLPTKGLLKLETTFHQSMHWHGKGDKTLLLGFRDIWQIIIIVCAFLLILI